MQFEPMPALNLDLHLLLIFIQLANEKLKDPFLVLDELSCCGIRIMSRYVRGLTNEK